MALIYAKGSPDQNRTYCSKADPNFIEIGNIKKSGSGSRTDLLEVTDYITSSVRTMEDVAENFPVQFVKFHRGLKDFKSLMDKKKIPEDRDVTVSVFHGEGGTGKTAYAITLCKKYNLDYYILSAPDSHTVWWDNYDGEKAIIIDDFYGWIKPHELFRICDRYKYKVPIKGSFVHAQWQWVFITSNNHPSKFYKQEVYDRLDSTAYFRRLHNIYQWAYYDDDKLSCIPIEKEKDERPLIEYLKRSSVGKSTITRYEYESTNNTSGSNEGNQNQTSTTVVTKPLTLDQDKSQPPSPDMADSDDF